MKSHYLCTVKLKKEEKDMDYKNKLIDIIKNTELTEEQKEQLNGIFPMLVENEKQNIV